MNTNLTNETISTHIIIRKARQEDLPVLLSFEQEIVRAERPFDTTLQEGIIHYYDLAAMLTLPEVEIAVAEDGNGKIVGSGYARIEAAKSYLKYSRYAYLGFMYVLPGYRGKGVIKKIVERLESFAKQNNVAELQLDVYAGNKNAIKAYEKAGFHASLIRMRKAVL